MALIEVILGYTEVKVDLVRLKRGSSLENMLTLVSVVIPCYNSEQFIEETINSVIGQSIADLEIICVNNNSTDGTLEVLNRLAVLDERIIVLNEKTAGANAARNTGLKQARGEYLQFLDADDVIISDKFVKQVKVLRDEGADIVVSDRAVYDERLNQQIEKITFPNLLVQPLVECISKIIITGNPLYRTEFVKKIGGYLPGLMSAQDWEFHIRLFLNNPKISYLPEVFLHSRKLSNSLSSDYLSVSMNACKVINLYKNELLENRVFEHKGAIEKIIFSYFVSYIHSGANDHKTQFLFWYNKSADKNALFTGLNRIFIRISGINFFLSSKRFLKKLKF